MSSSLGNRILAILAVKDDLSSLTLAVDLDEDHQKVVGAIKSLQSLVDVIKTEQLVQNELVLTDEGRQVVSNGSHEFRVWSSVPVDAGIEMDKHYEMNKESLGEGLRLGVNKAVSLGWLRVVKGVDGATRLERAVSKDPVDLVKAQLRTVQDGGSASLGEELLSELKRRKLVVSSSVTYFKLWRGPNFTENITDRGETELTAEMMASGEYEKMSFKPYNFSAMGTTLQRGHLHPLLKVKAEFLSILTDLGFSEMPTNRFVESSFWNFDALFVPQKHPARDVQDTFFLARPAHCSYLPEDGYVDHVAKVHSEGAYNSRGYQMEWVKEEAVRNVMRTHTTAVTARVLHALAQEKPFRPVKKFSIDRVFRNETLDATHLAEFHQVEGFVADRGLSLGHLIGVMKEFFGRLGIKQLRFKPAYNPYTEPSLEVFAFHEGLQKWVEVGNSGLFRPEMLLPMGLPEDVRVIAWGLSLERPTMIRYGIDNIRSLVGHKVDLRMVYGNALCRLDKMKA